MSNSKTIILKSAAQEKYVADLLNALPKSEENPQWCVVIKRYSRQRSEAINRLYWVWMNFLSTHKRLERLIEDEESGETQMVKISLTKDGWHAYEAIKHLTPEVIPCPRTKRDILIPRSTRTLSNREFADYMNAIKEEEAQEGRVMPEPSDLVWRIQ